MVYSARIQARILVMRLETKAVGRSGVKYDSSQSLITGYFDSCLFQFTWETQGIFADRTGAGASQQHPDFRGLPSGLRKAGLGTSHSCCCWAASWLGPSSSGKQFPCRCTSSEGWWPGLHRPTPTQAQAADFCLSLSLIYFASMLPDPYLLLTQSQNLPLATWAGSQALLWTTQATTHGSLLSDSMPEEQALWWSAHTSSACGMIQFSSKLFILLNMHCSF